MSDQHLHSCDKGYDGCAMRVVFSKPQNCPGFNDGDFRDGGSVFQHMGPETAKAREPNVTVLVRGTQQPKIALGCCSQMTTSCDS